MAELGVCLSEIIDGACSEFRVLDNIVANDPASFDWDLFWVFIGGTLLMWVTGVGFGYIVKSIKKGSRC